MEGGGSPRGKAIVVAKGRQGPACPWALLWGWDGVPFLGERMEDRQVGEV